MPALGLFRTLPGTSESSVGVNMIYAAQRLAGVSKSCNGHLTMTATSSILDGDRTGCIWLCVLLCEGPTLYANRQARLLLRFTDAGTTWPCTQCL
jgi:hypothetical protein